MQTPTPLLWLQGTGAPLCSRLGLGKSADPLTPREGLFLPWRPVVRLCQGPPRAGKGAP